MDKESEKPDEWKVLTEFANETKERLRLGSSLLEKNVAAINQWPDESFFVIKDSSLKKNTAFVKKLRNFLDSQKETILCEFESLNLSKYVEEVATAIVEAKIKTTDIPFILKISSAMHQRYVDFGPLFLDAWKKVFSVYKDVKHSNLSKLRVDLALFADLNTIGIFRESEGIRLLASQLTALTNGDSESFSNIGIICSFCRHCSDDWIGLIPRRIRLLSEKYGIEIARSRFLPSERQAKCRGLFNEYLTATQRHLQSLAKDARRIVSANREQLENRGELSEERQERAEFLVAHCRKFHDSLSVLSDLLDADPPADFASMIKEDMKSDEQNPTETDQEDTGGSMQLFEDEDTRLFYESLPDIKAMVPGILYKDSEQSKLDSSKEKIEEVDSAAEEIDVETVESELAMEKSVEEDAANMSDGAQSTERDKLPPSLNIDECEEDPSSSGKVLMETFLTQLPNCVNRDMIDRTAIDFCLNLNKRSNRRRLARALFMVPRTRYDLLPFYARLIAALAPVMSDLVQDINSMLTGEFRWRVSKRDQMNLESKLKTVRFIGELVKFRIFPTNQALSLLKLLLPQFVDHNIEMACAFLDTCGRFLYRLPTSHVRTKIYLEVMLRKKTALHMDQRYTIMIENTYYYCDPPASTRQTVEAVPLTPTMQYIRRLLWRDLDRTTVNSVLRSIRKIDWQDKELTSFLEMLFTRAWELRFTSINCLASVLSGLAGFHGDFAVAVVDNVIEDIRAGMELNLPQLYQRRLSMVKYIGLLYNYCLVDSPVIFKMLYSLLTFGVNLDHTAINPLDSPDSLFRITLIATLLEASGGFFDRGKKRRKLQIFIIYFQRYYWFKRSHPMWIQPTTNPDPTSPGTGKGPTVKIHKGSTESKHSFGTSTSSNPLDVTQASTEQSELLGRNPNAATDAPPPPGPPPVIFTPVAFPSAVEQYYTEVLAQLRWSLTRAKSFVQAQRLVTRLESRYVERLSRLRTEYGLTTGGGIAADADVVVVNGGDITEDSGVDGEAGRLTGPGHMDPIAEEAEPDLHLDDEDYVTDEDDDDDDDDEDEEEEEEEDEGEGVDNVPCGDEHEERSRRRMHRSSVDGSAVENGDQNRTEEQMEGNSPRSKEITNGSDTEKGDPVDSEEEEAIRLGRKPRYIDCPEDAEFREALDRMTAEAFLSVGPTATTGSGGGGGSVVTDTATGPIRPPILPAPDSLPLVAARTRSSAHSTVTSTSTLASSPNNRTPSHAVALLSALQTKSDDENSQPSHVVAVTESKEPVEDGEEQKSTVPFNMITRRGNRPHLVPLAVPETVQFAARYMQVEAAEREEKARMKKLVLEMHEAQKEEEMEWGHLGSQDAVLAHQFPVNVNRDRWVKYNHPKGAPDADTVFGTSSQRR